MLSIGRERHVRRAPSSLRARLSSSLEVAAIVSAAFVETAPPSLPVGLFSLRYLSRSLLMRAIARLCIKLAILMPLPPQLQAAAALVPVSLLWALVDVPTASANPGVQAHIEREYDKVNGRPGGASCGATDPVRYEKLVDLSNVDNPTTIGILALPDDVDCLDVVLSGDQALVSSKTFTEAVSLVDPTNPKVVGRIDGIGGRLAIGENGLLLGTAMLPFGLTNAPVDKLAGVQTAALNFMTFIKSAVPVMVDADGKSVEPQLVKYRALFPRDEVRTAELQILESGQIKQSLPATLDANGEGSVSVPIGMQHSPLEGMLVINKGEPLSSRPKPASRPLLGMPFTIYPNGPREVSADDVPIDITAMNPAVLLRQGADSGYHAPLLNWVPTGAAGAAVTSGAQAPASGLYSTVLIPALQAGSVQEVALKQGSTLLATSGPITIVPGAAASSLLIPSKAPQAPFGLGVVPADGETTIDLVLGNIADSAGNPIPDGTLVSWTIVEGDAGTLMAPTTPVFGGKSINQYRAGIEPGVVVIRAAVNGFETEAQVRQSRLITTLTHDGARLDVHVTSEAGILPLNGTPVFIGALSGTVFSESTLQNGLASALYVEPVRRPGEARRRHAYVFATAGRARGALNIDLFEFDPPQPGPRLTSGVDRLMGDRTDGASLQMSPDQTISFPSRTTVQVTGDPGQVVPLAIGTTRLPNVVPLAAYALDSIDDGIAPDLYGGMPATVATSVQEDRTEPQFVPGVYRFSGDGGLTIPDNPALHLAGAFGFNGWVRFDAPTPGEKILEKAGSFGLQVVDDQGVTRLEFYVMSGGARKQVLSAQAIAAATWYRFSAHVKPEGLLLTVSEGAEDEIVKVGEVPGIVDLSSSPLLIGSNLQGKLDEIVLYDLSRAPILTFPGGATRADVTLDASGSGQIEVWSSGVYTAPPEAGSGFGRSLGAGSIRVYEGPGQPEEQYVDKPRVFIYLDIFSDSFRECGTAIGAGEEGSVVASACDFFAGFLPYVGGYQVAREAFKTGKHFVQGKATTRDYITGSFVLVAGAVAALPAARPLMKMFGEARASVAGLTAEKILADDILKTMGEALEAGTIVGKDASEPGLLRLLSEGDSASKNALRELWPKVRGQHDTLMALERVGNALGQGRTVVLLNDMSKSEAIGAKAVEQLLLTLDKMQLPVEAATKVSDGAIIGMARFVKVTDNPATIERVWATLGSVPEFAGNGVRSEAMDRLFDMVRRGDQLNLSKWNEFLGQIKGIRPEKGVKDLLLSRNKVNGFMHHLELVVERAGQGQEIYRVDQAMAGYAGRPDLLIRDANGLFHQIEAKNLEILSTLAQRDVDQLVANVRAAIDRADALGGGSQRIADELSRIEYVFRGAESTYSPRLRQDILDLVSLELEPSFKNLADKLKLTFQNKRVPF